MKIKQLSVFLENKPGQLSEPCRVLAEAGVNILTLSLADTQQFGIMRLIIREWEKAKTVLEEAGSVVKLTDVVAIEVSDRPGGLADVLETLEECKVNIEYMYAFTFRNEGKAVLVFRFDQTEQAIQALESRNINLIGPQELYDRAEN
ncbi:MAG: ACT domain-containing protein [Phycisphaerae bacterium]